MKKQTLVMALTAVLAGTTSLAAMADNTSAVANNWNQFNVHSLYVGGNIGYGHVESTSHAGNNDGKSGFGWNAHVGYNFTPMWGAELGYTQFPYHQGDIYGGDSNYATDVVGKVTLPLQNDYSLFAKGGLAYEHHTEGSNSESQYSGLALYAGAGISYQLHPNLALVGEVDTTALGGTNIPMMYMGSVGVNYNF